MCFFFSTQGARLETACDGDWWESVVVSVQNDRVRIHYIGGDEDEDEWISKFSERLRPPQDDKVDSNGAFRAKECLNSFAEDHDSDNHQGDDASDHRPLRRSRMLSDDARFALQLQQQEVKAARGKGTFPRKRSKVTSNSRSSKSSDVVPFVSAQLISQGKDEGLGAKTSVQGKISRQLQSSSAGMSSKSVISPSSASRKGIGSGNSGAAALKMQGSKNPPLVEKSGTIAFNIIPDETSAEQVPALSRSRMCLMEDMTMAQVTRIIAEDALPGIPSSQIVLRTPTGMMVGHEHSLRYVRSFLWPRSKGELVLRYSLGKGSLF